MVKPELLAPAGSEDCLKAAILAGADAVYLAGKHFGARAFASNFDEEGLKWARRVTKASNTKLYITLNTIVFQHEWQMLCKTLDFLESLQPDSLIIQDLGIAIELRKRNSKIPLHLSTQGAWFGQGGIEELKELGFTRIILPRETTKNEIAEIVRNSPFEIEVFVHGAMCYSISGRCFWSASLGPRSGNRGTCAQPCRKEYCINSSNCFEPIFSPKDLRLINDINELTKTGVSSLKIEGRMKSPEYVYQVVKAYRAAIDGKKKDSDKNLDEVFSRASSNGFFYGIQKPSSWETGRNQGREGLVVGVTTGKVSNGLVEVVLKNEIKAGDGLFWYEADEKKGSKITFVKENKSAKKQAWVRGLPANIGKNTELRRTSKNDDESWKLLWDKSLERIPIELTWSGKENSPLYVETQINGQKILLSSEDNLVKAKQKGLDEGPLQEKFNVIGEEYKTSSHNFEMLEKKLFIGASALKSMKRELCKLLSKPLYNENLFKPYRHCEALKEPWQSINKQDSSSKTNVNKGSYPNRFRIWNEVELLTAELKGKYLVVPWQQRNKVSNQADQSKISYWLPPILNSKQFNEIYNELKNLKEGRFLCFGWEAFKLAKLLPKLQFELDWCFNIANVNSLNYLRNLKLDAVLSKEWKDEVIPQDVKAYRANLAWNPLVSYTRFRAEVKREQIVSNSHQDKFFTLSIGNDVTAMFLEKKISKFSKSPLPLQIDIAIAPNEVLQKKAFSLLSSI